MGEGDFRPPHSSETPKPIFMKFPDTTPHAKFQGLRRRGWSGQLSSLTRERTPRSVRHIRQATAFWGPERRNLISFTPQTRKNWDFTLVVN